jgi:hypothetical protein
VNKLNPKATYRSPQAADLLGVPYWRLHSLLRFSLLDPMPTRDINGKINWTREDLQRAKKALASRRHRQKKPVK